MMNYRMIHVLRRILFNKINSLSDIPNTIEKKQFPISKQNVCVLKLINPPKLRLEYKTKPSVVNFWPTINTIIPTKGKPDYI